jgi:hypothetical protein
LAERGIVSAKYVRDLLEAHRTGRVDATDAVWRLLNFELWNRVFFDRDPALLNQFSCAARDVPKIAKLVG